MMNEQSKEAELVKRYLMAKEADMVNDMLTEEELEYLELTHPELFEDDY